MFGNESKSKILKNKNGHTSFRTQTNLDTSYNLPKESNLNAKQNRNEQ